MPANKIFLQLPAFVQAVTANFYPGRFRESELASESRTCLILPDISAN